MVFIHSVENVKNVQEITLIIQDKNTELNNVVKDIKEFWSRNLNKDGLDSLCIICKKIKQAENKSTLDRFLHESFINAKRRASYSNLDFDICEQDVIDLYTVQNGLCTGTEL